MKWVIPKNCQKSSNQCTLHLDAAQSQKLHSTSTSNDQTSRGMDMFPLSHPSIKLFMAHLRSLDGGRRNESTLAARARARVRGGLALVAPSRDLTLFIDSDILQVSAFLPLSRYKSGENENKTTVRLLSE